MQTVERVHLCYRSQETADLVVVVHPLHWWTVGKRVMVLLELQKRSTNYGKSAGSSLFHYSSESRILFPLHFLRGCHKSTKELRHRSHPLEEDCVGDSKTRCAIERNTRVV